MSASLQETHFPDLTCFGCGPANPKGLQLHSFLVGDRYEASFTPWPEHDNGVGFLNGGIIATLLDCHSAAAVVDVAHQHGWRALGSALLPYVTAGLEVRYRRPAPLHEPVTLLAEVTSADERQITARVWLEHEDKVRAEADALWKRWRPRD
jgi:acyl-coenzyme A thioesterase PaaI-like protein